MRTGSGDFAMWRGGRTCGQVDTEVSSWNEEERLPAEEMGRLH